MSVRTPPYRTASLDRVVAEAWLRLDSPEVEVFGGPVPGWDYATDLLLRRDVTIDPDGVLTDAGLPQAAPLRLSVRSRPTASMIRTTEACVPVPAGGKSTVTLEISVVGQNLAGGLTLETLLELAEDVPEPKPYTAARAGSVLWRDHVDGALDGDSGLLPVAPVSFASAGLPREAAWYISLDTGRWDWAAMGSLIVLLNTDNRSVSAAITDPTTPEARTLLDTLEVDLVSDLVARAVDDDDFRDMYMSPEAEEDDYSLGALVRALVRVRLARPSESVDEALIRLQRLRSSDPSHYRAIVQDGLSYPRSTSV